MRMLFGRSRIVAVVAAVITVLSLTAASAVASPKARLSRDLSEALSTGDAAARDVILQADAATIDAVAARHGAVVKRRLATGAVLSVPGGKLSSLSDDAAVDHLSGDLIALDIRRCLHYLGDITGEVTTEDKLDYIFSKFCIGK